MLAPRDAWRRLATSLRTASRPPNTVRVARRDSLGRTLAAPVRATVSVPPADVSAMDGFALGERAAERAARGETLPVTGALMAGAPPLERLEPDAVMRIMTGAVAPPGTDRVIQVEWSQVERSPVERSPVERSPVERVRFTQVTDTGAHIRRGGEISKPGDPLFETGRVLGPSALALLATHGIDTVEVVRRPRVAILATGDEVVPADTVPGPGQLRDSNSAFLAAALRDLGLCPREEIVRLGIAPDERDALRDLVRRGLESDLLLVCGGVSMGELDLVEEILADLGCRVLFDQVAIQPGKPLVAAEHDAGWVLGLPGNPASVMVTFALFGRPLLRSLLGRADGFWNGALRGELCAPLPGAKARDRFLPASVTAEDGRLLVTPAPPRGSHDTARYALGGGLVRVRAHAEPAAAGAPCEVLPLVDWPIAEL